MANEKNNELLPVYLVVGEDALKREAVMRRLRVRLEKMGDLSFNFDSFEGANSEPVDIITACETMPFASEKRLVQINDADKLKKGCVDALVEYIKSPNASTVLILIAEKLAKNNRLYKSVGSVGKSSIIDCSKPKAYKLQSHVRAMGPTHGITLTDDAAAKLIELVGDDTVRLDSEIKKLAIAHRGSDAVNANEVVNLVARSAEVKPWEFVDAFAARNLSRCIEYLPHIANNSPVGLLTMCVNRIRELMCAKSMLAQGGNAASDLAESLGVPEWKVKNHIGWSKGFSEKELRSALVDSYETEKAMKSGTQPDAAFIDWLVNTIG